MYIKINMDKPFFDDIEPEDKYSEELILMVLKGTAGEAMHSNKYNDREINRCARKLINGGYLHGTVFDFNYCAWSRLTKKGRFLLEQLKNDLRNKEAEKCPPALR